MAEYTRGTTEYAVATTLLDRCRYRIDALADLYHARLTIEEMYKMSKRFLEYKQFHSRSRRLVNQEMFADFNLIALTRLLTDPDAALCATARSGQPVSQANFKHRLVTLAKHLECLLLRQRAHVSETLQRICEVDRYRSLVPATAPLLPATLPAPGLEMRPGAASPPHSRPDADTAGRRNGHDLSTSRLHEHSSHAQELDARPRHSRIGPDSPHHTRFPAFRMASLAHRQPTPLPSSIAPASPPSLTFCRTPC